MAAGIACCNCGCGSYCFFKYRSQWDCVTQEPTTPVLVDKKCCLSGEVVGTWQYESSNCVAYIWISSNQTCPGPGGTAGCEPPSPPAPPEFPNCTSPYTSQCYNEFEVVYDCATQEFAAVEFKGKICGTDLSTTWEFIDRLEGLCTFRIYLPTGVCCEAACTGDAPTEDEYPEPPTDVSACECETLLPCGEDCEDQSAPEFLPVSLDGWSMVDATPCHVASGCCLPIYQYYATSTGNLNGTYDVPQIGPCLWEGVFPGPVSTYYVDYIGGVDCSGPPGGPSFTTGVLDYIKIQVVRAGGDYHVRVWHIEGAGGGGPLLLDDTLTTPFVGTKVFSGGPGSLQNPPPEWTGGTATFDMPDECLDAP